jgi:hypothetical protein
MSKAEPQRVGFWATIRRLRSDGVIEKHWTRNDIRPYLSAAGYSENAIRAIPSNGSISRDGRVRGNYTARGGMPHAYRLGKGLYELIESTSAGDRLTAAIRTVLPRKKHFIEAQKDTARFECEDFIWEALLLSMATMGNSRGVALVRTREHHSRITWAALAKLSGSERQETLSHTLAAAGVRMAKRKAGWLAENFDRILAAGGPGAVKAELENTPGRDAKVQFLRTFRGIGDKYARNLLMDVYHPDFRDSIAIDVRIQKVSAALGVHFRTYAEGEEFYLSVARATGINGWELDRLLYGFTNDVLAALPEV